MTSQGTSPDAPCGFRLRRETGGSARGTSGCSTEHERRATGRNDVPPDLYIGVVVRSILTLGYDSFFPPYL